MKMPHKMSQFPTMDNFMPEVAKTHVSVVLQVMKWRFFHIFHTGLSWVLQTDIWWFWDSLFCCSHRLETQIRKLLLLKMLSLAWRFCLRVDVSDIAYSSYFTFWWLTYPHWSGCVGISHGFWIVHKHNYIFPVLTVHNRRDLEDERKRLESFIG